MVILGVIPVIAVYKLKISYATSMIKSSLLRLTSACCAFFPLALAIVAPNYQLYSFIGRENHTLAKEILPVSYFNRLLFKYARNTYFPKHYPYVSLGDDAQLASTSDKPKVFIFCLR